MKFYLYDDYNFDIMIKWDYDKFFLNRWFKSTYNYLINHSNRTSDPKEANYFIVTSSLRIMAYTGFNLNNFKHYILSLQYLNEGPHIVFDFSDHTLPLFRNLHKNIVHFKSAFGNNTYRPHLDINMPQFQRYFLDFDIIPIKNREIIASFRGAPRLNSCKIRQNLFNLNDNNKFIYLDSGDFEFEINNNNMIIKKSDDKTSYLNLICNSIFSICIRGCGTALSYRLIEVLNVGSIPVIISDNYPLPLNDEIDWNEISIIIKEKDIDNLNNILLEKSKDFENLQKMQDNIKIIFNKYFNSFENLIENSLRIFENKITNEIKS